MKNKKTIEFGFSIIEILVAITFFTVGILTIANMFSFGMNISSFSEYKTIAATLAQDKMEELIAFGYDGINVGTIEEKHKVQQGSFGGKYNFYRETITAYVDGDLAEQVSDTGMKKIETTVFWNVNDGTEKSFLLKRLISRR
ncbi:MAG: hypothetical protein ABIC82_01110 [bacterium]